jgi:hypothetical protein
MIRKVTLHCPALKDVWSNAGRMTDLLETQMRRIQGRTSGRSLTVDQRSDIRRDAHDLRELTFNSSTNELAPAKWE